MVWVCRDVIIGAWEQTQATLIPRKLQWREHKVLQGDVSSWKPHDWRSYCCAPPSLQFFYTPVTRPIYQFICSPAWRNTNWFSSWYSPHFLLSAMKMTVSHLLFCIELAQAHSQLLLVFWWLVFFLVFFFRMINFFLSKKWEITLKLWCSSFKLKEHKSFQSDTPACHVPNELCLTSSLLQQRKRNPFKKASGCRWSIGMTSYTYSLQGGWWGAKWRRIIWDSRRKAAAVDGGSGREGHRENLIILWPQQRDRSLLR